MGLNPGYLGTLAYPHWDGSVGGQCAFLLRRVSEVSKLAPCALLYSVHNESTPLSVGPCGQCAGGC